MCALFNVAIWLQYGYGSRYHRFPLTEYAEFVETREKDTPMMRVSRYVHRYPRVYKGQNIEPGSTLGTNIPTCQRAVSPKQSFVLLNKPGPADIV